MAEDRAVVLGRAVSSSACRLGVALRDRRPSETDVPELRRLAAQCLELAGGLDAEQAARWLALAEDVAHEPHTSKPAAQRQRRTAA